MLRRKVLNLVQFQESLTLNASGNGSVQVGQAPPGIYIEIERATVVGAGTGSIYIFHAGTVTAALQPRTQTIAGAARGDMDANSAVRFWPNENIIFQVIGGTASASVTLYVQALAVSYDFVPDEPTGAELAGYAAGGNGAVGRGRTRSPEPVGWN